MLQKQMVGMTMVLMPQMAKFMNQDIILKHLGQAYDIKIEIDVHL